MTDRKGKASCRAALAVCLLARWSLPVNLDNQIDPVTKKGAIMQEAIKELAREVAKVGSGIYLNNITEEALSLLIELDQIAIELLDIAKRFPIDK